MTSTRNWSRLSVTRLSSRSFDLSDLLQRLVHLEPALLGVSDEAHELALAQRKSLQLVRIGTLVKRRIGERLRDLALLLLPCGEAGLERLDFFQKRPPLRELRLSVCRSRCTSLLAR